MGCGSLKTRGIASLCAAFLSLPAAAQIARADADTPRDPELRAVSWQEGETIVQAAWQLRKGLGSKPDCSHFVHQVYVHAGLDYEYASSVAIYHGVPEFRRVQSAQPGDLIVWPGHVGIMIDPNEHTFYSSVVKGYAIENYKSRYWARRGPPRFYRYLIDQVRIAGLQTRMNSVRAAAEPRPHSGAPHMISDEPVSSAENASGHTQETEKADDVKSSDAEMLDTVFITSRAKPSKSEIQSALTTLAAANGARALRMGPVQSLNVEVASELMIESITIHGHSGSTEIAIHETASIRNGRAYLRQRVARWHLALQHETEGWIMLVPSDKACVPRDQVIQALSAHLSQLAREADNESELKRTLKVLDDLLGTQTRYVPVAGSD